MWPLRQQPTRLCRPWDSPGKNSGVCCHFLLQCMRVKSKSEVAQSCPTLCNPMDCSLPDSSVHGIFQARVLEWVAFAFSVGYLEVCFLNSMCFFFFFYSFFFLMSVAKGLSILFIFSKNQLLVLLIFTFVSFISFSFISAWMFMISFHPLLLGFSFHPMQKNTPSSQVHMEHSPG